MWICEYFEFADQKAVVLWCTKKAVAGWGVGVGRIQPAGWGPDFMRDFCGLSHNLVSVKGERVSLCFSLRVNLDTSFYGFVLISRTPTTLGEHLPIIL